MVRRMSEENIIEEEEKAEEVKQSRSAEDQMLIDMKENENRMQTIGEDFF